MPQIRQGISIPPDLSRNRLFLRHTPNGNDVRGVFAGSKDNTPNCIVNLNVVHVSASYLMDVDDRYVGADTSVAALSVTLPTPIQINDGHQVIIKDEGGNAGVLNITISTPGAETTDVAAINTNGGIARLMWDKENSNWIEI